MNTATTLEANFDGLVGPTHNYAGLSFGNVASQNNLGSESSPRAAALQGLAKMKAMHDLGLMQGVLPPQQRPDLAALRRLGFAGSDAEVLGEAARTQPRLLGAVSSASSMWVANAATVSPSADTRDGRVHFTPANLVNKFHRSIEVPTTARALQAIFPEGEHFAHHAALPAVDDFGDEGAANHTRLCAEYGEPGLELFVYGKDAGAPEHGPQRYPARHTLQASQAVARLHGLAPQACVFLQQNPAVIDQGVFHNDVIAVGNRNVLFFHEQAFVQDPRPALAAAWQTASPLHCIEVPSAAVSVEDAVSSYLFNSQLVTLPAGGHALILPQECRDNPAVWAYLQGLLDSDGPIEQFKVFNLTESMRNGGGPACLRLRVVLTPAQQAALNSAALLDETLYARLKAWVERHYRERLHVQDLADPQLHQECCSALDELTGILKLGAIYPFQQV
ncbi:succinylarginine dihydrolase [Oceanococcus atlanticus]|uniref:N-succinylarginine dihydrolase n=1 Tax=Oceanococcus atlanticus TaxID=1317117 RepID=A0A1Y1SF28_9GAMM|nr:N-succinylarginine dihydrolase [Oceanococcus atlanticus]ORE87304.1 succinylarginine dihydrolase [Oceanococcus atlanticus]